MSCYLRERANAIKGRKGKDAHVVVVVEPSQKHHHKHHKKPERHHESHGKFSHGKGKHHRA